MSYLLAVLLGVLSSIFAWFFIIRTFRTALVWSDFISKTRLGSTKWGTTTYRLRLDNPGWRAAIEVEAFATFSAAGLRRFWTLLSLSGWRRRDLGVRPQPARDGFAEGSDPSKPVVIEDDDGEDSSRTQSD